MIRVAPLFVMATLLMAWRPLQAESTTIWVERDQHHTAVLIPTADARQLPGVVVILKNSNSNQEQGYIRFGWGDRDYYGARRQSPAMAARALLMPTRSVVEVSVHSGDTAPDNAIAFQLTAPEMERLKKYIHHSFRTDHNGQPRLIRNNGIERYYYAAQESYHLFRNCNHWTAEAMRQTGIKIRQRPLMLAKPLMHQLRREAKNSASLIALSRHQEH